MTISNPRAVLAQAFADACQFRSTYADAGDLELVQRYRAMAADLDAIVWLGKEAFHGTIPVSSGVAPDGSARLIPEDVQTVIGALNDGAREAVRQSQEGHAARYLRLARSLGDDR